MERASLSHEANREKEYAPGNGRQCRDKRGTSMSFTEHRLELIRDLLRQKQRVQVKDLVDQLKVSQESIRRDLREPETHGFARAAECFRKQ